MNTDSKADFALFNLQVLALAYTRLERRVCKSVVSAFDAGISVEKISSVLDIEPEVVTEILDDALEDDVMSAEFIDSLLSTIKEESTSEKKDSTD